MAWHCMARRGIALDGVARRWVGWHDMARRGIRWQNVGWHLDGITWRGETLDGIALDGSWMALGGTEMDGIGRDGM
eukprot:11224769-Lingulodinium_polyedra.AAC.1